MQDKSQQQSVTSNLSHASLNNFLSFNFVVCLSHIATVFSALSSINPFTVRFI